VKKAILSFCLVFIFLLTQAQHYTISGFVEDSISGEALIHASVINTNSKAGIVTNDYGFFSISSNMDSIQMDISYVGYKKLSISLINLKKDTTLKVHLSPFTRLDEVVIVGNKNEKVKSSQVSMSKIDLKKAALLPVFAGENDLVKTIQLLPGVQSGTEGTGGLQIRGGSQGDNLVLLDGAPVYNVNHMWGFFSVFNTDAIQNVELYKGGFPARYGGRLSSVLDIRMKEGNDQKFEGSGSIGLISSKLTLQGPIVKDKTSFIISARRSYLDIFFKPFTKDFGYYFYDASVKVNHRFSSNSRLFLSLYTGKDNLFFTLNEDFLGEGNVNKTESNNSWGNLTSSLRWNYIFNSKLFLNTTLIYSKYRANVNSEVQSTLLNEQQKNTGRSFSNLQNNSAMFDFSYFPNTKHSVKFGGSYTYFTYLPISKHVIYSKNDLINYDSIYWNQNVNAHEIHTYAEDDIDFTSKLKSNIGLHASFYHVNNKWYKSLEPRISIRYLLTPDLSLKIAYTEMQQYVFQYPNIMSIYKKGNNVTLNANPEVWLPATNILPPQKSKQIVIGSILELDKGYDISVEGFYKSLSNVIEDGEFNYNQQPEKWENLFEIGKGYSYGMELYAEKKLNKITGWIAYTLSKTERQFDNLNNGKAFPYTFDRRHNLNIVFNQKYRDKFDIGIVWVYGSGRCITLPDEQYISNFNFATGESTSDKNDISGLSPKNAYRMPAYHRLDIGLNFHKQKKWGERTWSMGVYNAYNHHNSFLVYVDYNKVNGQLATDKKVIKSISLFPILPYITYSFKF
jgi:hypothetical protein